MKSNMKRLAMLFVAAATLFAIACSKNDDKDNSSTNNSQEAEFEMARLDLTYRWQASWMK